MKGKRDKVEVLVVWADDPGDEMTVTLCRK